MKRLGDSGRPHKIRFPEYEVCGSLQHFQQAMLTHCFPRCPAFKNEISSLRWQVLPHELDAAPGVSASLPLRDAPLLVALVETIKEQANRLSEEACRLPTAKPPPQHPPNHRLSPSASSRSGLVLSTKENVAPMYGFVCTHSPRWPAPNLLNANSWIQRPTCPPRELFRRDRSVGCCENVVCADFGRWIGGMR